jgi:hypothetical protein
MSSLFNQDSLGGTSLFSGTDNTTRLSENVETQIQSAVSGIQTDVNILQGNISTVSNNLSIHINDEYFPFKNATNNSINALQNTTNTLTNNLSNLTTSTNNKFNDIDVSLQVKENKIDAIENNLNTLNSNVSVLQTTTGNNTNSINNLNNETTNIQSQLNVVDARSLANKLKIDNNIEPELTNLQTQISNITIDVDSSLNQIEQDITNLTSQVEQNTTKNNGQDFIISELNGNKMDRAGDTMTGNLNMSNNDIIGIKDINSSFRVRTTSNEGQVEFFQGTHNKRFFTRSNDRNFGIFNVSPNRTQFRLITSNVSVSNDSLRLLEGGGRVGINRGGNFPAETLDVGGSIRARGGLIIDNTANITGNTSINGDLDMNNKNINNVNNIYTKTEVDNLLIDSSSGSWTPTATFGVGDITQTSSQIGRFHKIDNQVFIHGTINFDNTRGSSSGTNIRIDGLPWRVVEPTTGYPPNYGITISVLNEVNYTGFWMIDAPSVGFAGETGFSLRLRKIDGLITRDDVKDNFFISFSGWYITDNTLNSLYE